MKKIVAIFLLSTACIIPSISQSALTLEQCYSKAMENHPYGLQRVELEKINILTGRINASAWLPQLSLQGQVTWQSDVIEIDIPLPGAGITGQSPDQYRIFLEAQQLIYDGGSGRRRDELQSVSHKAELQEIEVRLYQLLEQVNRHFFQLFLLEENLRILDLTRTELEERLGTVGSAVANGVLLPSAQWSLEAEIIRLGQSRSELEESQRSNRQILEILVGEELTGMQPELPHMADYRQGGLNRPELTLFSLQREQLLSAARLTETGNMPRISGFMQAGYGKPGLNMLSDQFDPWYMAGVRLSWNLWNWQKSSREGQIKRMQASLVDAGQQAFEQNIAIALTSVTSKIEQLERALESDRQITALQEKIVGSARSQLENGVITSTEYLHHVNSLARARLAHQTNRIRLLQAIAEYNIIKGNI